LHSSLFVVLVLSSSKTNLATLTLIKTREEFMSNLTEMAADIVAAHASTTPMTKEELIAELTAVYNALTSLEQGADVAEQAEEVPVISKKKAFGKDKVICLICGKEMKTLTRHLRTAHGLKPAEYRVQFDLPKTQSLVARNYSASRRQMAIEKGLGDNLAKARAARGKKSKKN
jgi:predicted transcriptional regulator